MKIFLLSLGAIATLASCTTSNTAATAGTINTITKVAQISSAISEISSVLGGLGLTSTQSSLVKTSLTNYIKNYNSLDETSANYKSALANYKTEALGEIKEGIGASKYGQFISTLKTVSQTQQSTVSNSALAVISSLIK